MRAGYESLAGRRRAVVVLFLLLVAIDLVAVWFSFLELNLLDRIEAGELVGDDEITANDTRIGVIGITQTVAYLACAIVFIRWLRAAYRNADVLAPGVRRYGHGWAIGAWFVPFLNLFRPKQIVNDVWRAGAPAGQSGGRPPVLLLAWWLSWVAGTILGRVALQSALEQDTIDEIRTADFWWIISDGWDAVNAVMAIAVVRYLTRRLDGKAAAEPEPAEPQPAGEPQAWAPTAPERPVALD